MIIALIVLCAWSCKTSDKIPNQNTDEINTVANDTVKIANDELEYEIIIIEPGFNFWLQSQAQQRGFYTQKYLENRNFVYVTEWNNRVLDPQRFSPNLYELQINYNRNIDYGYEVNYLLYNYFIFFQNRFKQNLMPGARVPIN